MSLSFPSASTVLVFNLGGGTETLKTLTPSLGAGQTHTTAPEPKPAVSKPTAHVEAAPENKEQHIGELLAEVDSAAYQIAAPADWDMTPHDKPPAPTEKMEPPSCNTELSVPVNVHQNPSPLALQVGHNGEVPRWRPGSVIKWNWFTTGWPGGAAQANEVGNMMVQATFEWNRLNIGVSFDIGKTLQECTFVLGYNARQTSLIAEAFFPNSNDLNYINVYSQGIYSSWYSQLRAVFLHELGHVLGLRHEFAMDPTNQYEGGSVQFGPRDAYSVMNYRPEPPAITQNDINSARAFYAFTGSAIGGMRVTDYTPY